MLNPDKANDTNSEGQLIEKIATYVALKIYAKKREEYNEKTKKEQEKELLKLSTKDEVLIEINKQLDAVKILKTLPVATLAQQPKDTYLQLQKAFKPVEEKTSNTSKSDKLNSDPFNDVELIYGKAVFAPAKSVKEASEDTPKPEITSSIQPIL